MLLHSGARAFSTAVLHGLDTVHSFALSSLRECSRRSSSASPSLTLDVNVSFFCALDILLFQAA